MRDPGLQPERTSLAWSRTALSMLITAGVCLKVGMDSQRLGIIASGIFLFVGALLIHAFGMTRKRELMSSSTLTKAPSGHLVAIISALTLAGAGTATLVLSMA